MEAKDQSPTSPVVKPEMALEEFTLKALLLSAALSIILASANAYIGLLVGMTVSASIPAAAVSMGVLRAFRQSNILENNMVQTSASAGESLAAGIIFTVPALVIMGGWSGYHYWPIVVIGLLGGVLGVAFTIPLRRALIIEANLTFPEGVATSEVLQVGGIAHSAEKSGRRERSLEATIGLKALLEATAIGGIFKLLESGFGVFTGHLMTTQVWMQGRFLFTANVFLSPSLLGLGYIVGLNIAFLVFAGGLLGTIVGVPINWALNSDQIMEAVGIARERPLERLSADEWLAIAEESWQNCRRAGVGAMLVGGFWSLFSLVKPVLTGIRSSIRIYRGRGLNRDSTQLRTERDIPFPLVSATVLLSAIPLFFVFHWVLGDFLHRTVIAVALTVMMLFFGFLFSSVAGYMSGLVGSSNNPISGVTIATVVVTAYLLVLLIGRSEMAATVGPIMVVFLAANICTAAAIAGDNMQDLKCGHLLGATPWRQQVYQLVGVISAAFVIPLVLHILDLGHGIGRPSSNGTTFLAAPQAGLIKDISTAIFGADIQWNYVVVGMTLAVVLIATDQILDQRRYPFRIPVLAVAVGIYLPMGISLLIFAGGGLAYILSRKKSRSNDPSSSPRIGLLIASGLITGEALMGVSVAVAAVTFHGRMPSDHSWAPLLGIAAIIALGFYLFQRPRGSIRDLRT